MKHAQTKQKMYITFWWRNPWEKDHLGDLGIIKDNIKMDITKKVKV
jgi:hypothetical protein